MRELEGRDQYLALAGALANTRTGSAILSGEQREWVLEDFHEEIVEAMRGCDLEYARMYRVRHYAQEVYDEGAEPKVLHRAIADVAQRRIERYTYRAAQPRDERVGA